MGTWGVAQAKAQFSEVIEKAMTEGPQEITKGGKDAVVVVSKRDWMERAEPREGKRTKFLSAWNALKPSFDERYDDVEFPRIDFELRSVDLE